MPNVGNASRSHDAHLQGVAKDTRGTAFVVYEDIYDAKMAVEHLSGFNVANRYLIVLYYNPSRQTKKVWGGFIVLFPQLLCSQASPPLSVDCVPWLMLTPRPHHRILQSAAYVAQHGLSML